MSSPRDAMIQRAAELRLEAPALEGAEVSLPSARYRLLSVAELTELPEPEPLVDGLLSRGTLAMIVAKYDSYKSFVALDLGLHIAMGLDWHGREVQRGAVVYVYAEGAHGILRRVDAWRQLNRVPEVGGIYFLPRAVLLNEPRDCAGLLVAIAGLPEQPAAVFIDTVARTYKGNESAGEDMNAYISACDEIKERTGATVVLVHHTGWEGTRSRGSTNLPGALDTEITLTRDGDRVSIATTKQKDGPEGPIVTLEALPIGRSLAFKALGPTSSRLSDNERLSLSEVHATPGVSASSWMAATGLPRSSFYAAKARLLTLVYVRRVGKEWFATDAGVQALSPRSSTSPSEVQASPSTGSPALPRSLERDAGPGLTERSASVSVPKERELALSEPQSSSGAYPCSVCGGYEFATPDERCIACKARAA